MTYLFLSQPKTCKISNQTKLNLKMNGLDMPTINKPNQTKLKKNGLDMPTTNKSTKINTSNQPK